MLRASTTSTSSAPLVFASGGTTCAMTGRFDGPLPVRNDRLGPVVTAPAAVRTCAAIV